MLWTILTVILVVGAFLVIGSMRFLPGGKNIGDAREQRSRLWSGLMREQRSRLWSGLWKKEDADRLR